jgi:ATP-binding cassette subfamily B (MDR/TAP) protein 1
MDEEITPNGEGSVSRHSSSVEGSSAINEKHILSNPPEDAVSIEKLDSQIISIKEEGDDPLRHLSTQERAIIERQLDIPPVDVTFGALFRYATKNDFLIIFISATCAIAGGAVMPLMTVSLKDITACSRAYWLTML